MSLVLGGLLDRMRIWLLRRRAEDAGFAAAEFAAVPCEDRGDLADRAVALSVAT